MAVENKYTDANLVAGKKASALVTGSGTDVVTIVNTVAVAAGDDNGSIYRVFADVPSSLVPVSIQVHNTAITSGTDYDLGLYKAGLGAVVDKDILADGLSMASARAIATANNVGITTLDLAALSDLATLGAATDPDASYDIAFTANTVGTAAGTIRVTATFAYK